jgi:peroxiredoxin
MRKVVLLVIAVALAIGVYDVVRHGRSHSRTGGARGSVDSVAPGFSLQDLTGQPLALSNYKGKVVLLDYWATWCTPCRGEIPHFVEFQDNYSGQGLQVLGVSMDDDVKPVREFYQQYKMNYPVAMGSAELADSYGGILGLPVTFLIDRDGRIAAKYVGAVDVSVIENKMQALLQNK